MIQREWQGDNPFCLVIAPSSEDSVIIDLDQSGWLKTYDRFMRGASRWFLVSKKDMVPVLWMLVHDGEQPYYTTRHVGIGNLPEAANGSKPPSSEALSYGIGKKRLDGHIDRLWILPNGAVTLGDDVDQFANEMLRSSLAQFFQQAEVEAQSSS